MTHFRIVFGHGHSFQFYLNRRSRFKVNISIIPDLNGKIKHFYPESPHHVTSFQTATCSFRLIRAGKVQGE